MGMFKFIVGDLVRVRGKDWARRPLAIVTEVKEIRHEESGASYVAVTAACAGELYTFSEKDFDLIKRVERNKN